METGFIIAVVVLCVVVGVFAVCLIVGKGKSNATKNDDVTGTLNVVLDDAGPGLFVALSIPIEEIINQKRVTFDVNVIQQNSRK